MLVFYILGHIGEYPNNISVILNNTESDIQKIYLPTQFEDQITSWIVNISCIQSFVELQVEVKMRNNAGLFPPITVVFRKKLYSSTVHYF